MPTVEINGVAYEVYGSQEDALEYFRARLGSEAWDAASSNDQRKALVTASRWLDRLRWVGAPSVPGQPLAWPRTGASLCDGTAIPDDEIPLLVVQASFELALVALRDAAAPESPSPLGGSLVQEVHAGSVGVTFFAPVRGSQLPKIVNELLRCLLESGAATSAESFGTGLPSGFEDPDKFGLTNPLP